MTVYHMLTVSFRAPILSGIWTDTLNFPLSAYAFMDALMVMLEEYTLLYMHMRIHIRVRVCIIYIDMYTLMQVLSSHNVARSWGY